MSNTPQPGHEYESRDPNPTDDFHNKSPERLTTCQTEFIILSPADVVEHLEAMIFALQHGFEITVRTARNWASEGPALLVEEVVSRLMAAIRRHRLKRFHLRRVHFEFVE